MLNSPMLVVDPATTPGRDNPEGGPAGGRDGTPPRGAGWPEVPPGADTFPAASIALTSLTIVSAVGFARVFTTSPWVWPVIATAILAHVAGWLLRRLRMAPTAALPVVMVVAGLAAVYLVFPGDLTLLLPLRHSWSAVDQSLIQAGQGIRTMVTPVPALPGFVLLAAWGTGIIAAAADWLAFHVRSSLLALLPALVLFITCSALGTVSGRVWAIGLEVAAMTSFALVHRTTVEHQRTAWFAGRRAGLRRWTAAVGAGIGAVALVAALVVTPAVPQSEGTGVLGWKLAGNGASNRITPSPLDQLKARKLNETNTPVMTVRASVPSYWRLTSLDTFTGSSWEADHSYSSFDTNLPGVGPAPPGTREVVDQFHIQDLNSIWLPAAFDPIAVRGGHRVTWDPVSDSLISSQATSNGENYEVVSVEQLASLSPADLSAAGPPSSQMLARYTQLPRIPRRVIRLAQSITASAKTEYAKALALEQYFHQPSFIYSTNPPSNDSTSALEYFLFQSKTGYCQQFAGAYAVLARAVGIPTRIAVGFQSGTPDAHGVYQVIDADAHAWPEVYFAGIGWVPFEPTPGRQIPGSVGYAGNTANIQTPTSSTPSTTTPSPGVTVPSVTKQRPQAAPKNGQSGAQGAHRGGLAAPIWAGIALGGIIALVAGWAGAVFSWRRLRWYRRRRRADGGPPAAQVLTAWDEAVETLAWWGLQRRGDETVGEFAARAAAKLRFLLGGDSDEAGAVETLASLTERAAFGESAPDDGDRAPLLAGRLARGLWYAAALERRVSLVLDPRHAWGPSTVLVPSEAGARPSGRRRGSGGASLGAGSYPERKAGGEIPPAFGLSGWDRDGGWPGGWDGAGWDGAGWDGGWQDGGWPDGGWESKTLEAAQD